MRRMRLETSDPPPHLLETSDPPPHPLQPLSCVIAHFFFPPLPFSLQPLPPSLTDATSRHPHLLPSDQTIAPSCPGSAAIGEKTLVTGSWPRKRVGRWTPPCQPFSPAIAYHVSPSHLHGSNDDAETSALGWPSLLNRS